MQENVIKPAVSVIMNCLNCSKYLRESIDSVFTQTYQDWEIIFYDDCSTDNSLEIAKSYGSKVKCFKSDKIYSLGKVRNLAIQESQSDYIAFLDCDDVWLPNKLKKQIPLFEKDASVGIVCSRALFFDANGKDFKNQTKTLLHQGLVFGQLLKDYFLSLPTVVIRKKALLDLPEWFDEHFSQIEEMDVFLRIAHDWKVASVDEVLAKYRVHKESWTFTHAAFAPKEREMLIQKYSHYYPDFQEKYTHEIAMMRNQIGYETFSIYWLKCQAKEGRQAFKPFLRWNKKLIPYVFSYIMPASFFYFLIKMAIKIRILNKVAEFH